MKKDIIIFGAGKLGQRALQKYGERVDYFIDNNRKLQNSKVDGIAVTSVEKGVEDISDHTIVIAGRYQEIMAEQLKELGVEKYLFYLGNPSGYYYTEELVLNPYLKDIYRDVSETEWNRLNQESGKIQVVNDMVEKYQGREIMFDHVEIETVNRCNGSCDFCPVSKRNDIREYAVMKDELFESIILQLAEINYAGRLALFSNNEPFLDPDILKRHKYAREKLPKARMHLFTNGTLLTIDRFKELILYLDELIIDNYQQDLKLIKPCQEIVSYCEEHPELNSKVTIVLRKPKEILSSRGGSAPNRKDIISYKKDRCVLPYKQLIIRPDGKVSLCCSDALGQNTLGDLTKDSIMEVWDGQEFKAVRRALYEGRENWKYCQYCDFFSIG